MKMSDLDIFDAKNFLRIDYDDDDFFIEMALESAKSWVCNYCKRPIEDLDQYPECCMAALLITAHFYDERTLQVDSTGINYTIDSILGGHHFYIADSALEDGE